MVSVVLGLDLNAFVSYLIFIHFNHESASVQICCRLLQTTDCRNGHWPYLYPTIKKICNFVISFLKDSIKSSISFDLSKIQLDKVAFKKLFI